MSTHPTIPARGRTPHGDGPLAPRDVDVDALYRRFRRRALTIASSFLRDRHDAEDAVQDAFLRVEQAASRFNARALPQTWLHRILVNVCLDAQRRRRRRPEVALDDSEEGELALISAVLLDSELERVELGAQLASALDRLSDTHRAALLLREGSGLEYREIAAIQGCPTGTVMSRLFHARRNLRRILGPRCLGS